MVPVWRPQQWLLGDMPNCKLLPATFHCRYLKSIKSLFFHPDSQIPRRCSIIITCGSISTMSGLFNVSIFFNSIIHQPICQLEIAGDVACTSAMKTVMDGLSTWVTSLGLALRSRHFRFYWRENTDDYSAVRPSCDSFNFIINYCFQRCLYRYHM